MPKKKKSGCLGGLIVLALIGVGISTMNNDEATESRQTNSRVSEDQNSDTKSQTVTEDVETFEPLPTDAFDLKTKTGVTYEQSTITRVGIDGLGIRHKTGIATVPFNELEDSFREKHGLTEEREQAYKKKLADEAQKTFQEGAEARQKAIDEKFLSTSMEAEWVTYIEQAGTDFHVRLPAAKYTTRENVKSIAEFIAKAYVMQSKNGNGTAKNATVHVWKGDSVYLRGSYRD